MSLSKRLALAFAVVILMSAQSCPKERYGDRLNDTWRQVFSLSPSDGEYRWSGYAVDNFGVLTAYDPPSDRDWIDSDRICATWSCLDIDYTKIPTNPEDRLWVLGYADKGSGGGITLTQEQTNAIGAKLVLPNLAAIANIGANLDWKRGVKTTMTLGKAHKRSVNRDKYQTFIEKQSKNGTLQQAFGAGRLNYVAADIVAESMDVTITVDKATNAGLDAALTKAAGSVAKDSSVKVSIATSGNGVFHIKAENPVVLAVQTRRQPAGGRLTGTGTNLVVRKPLPRPEFKLF